jgi:hypothetical protein
MTDTAATMLTICGLIVLALGHSRSARRAAHVVVSAGTVVAARILVIVLVVYAGS